MNCYCLLLELSVRCHCGHEYVKGITSEITYVEHMKWINLLWPSEAMRRHKSGNLGSDNGLLPDDTKPLPEPRKSDITK